MTNLLGNELDRRCELVHESMPVRAGLTVKRPCLTCGTLTPTGSYCPQHAPRRPSRQTPGRGGGWQAAKFRAEVLRFAGYVCQRCGTDGALQAHRVRPLVEGGTNDPSNGVALCRRCHEAVEGVASP